MNGKWMDGWESARHGTLKRGGRDFCIIRLGVPGSVVGVDIDTLHFTGNYAEAASIEACNVEGDLPWWRLLEDDVKWYTVRVLRSFVFHSPMRFIGPRSCRE
jgi:allantoicase